ncbi:GntR family transcriptional regulator [candidate division KSB1 bacterium]|nr:GntR family transcriptional regulator [candidate division KSB1 bacterium]
MILNLTDISDEPLQSQIVRQIRAKILSGELPAESDLPSIRAMARDHRVSVITVQRAYEILLREKLIHARRGKGFFVSQIDKKSKKDLAKQRLFESLMRPIREAMAEGLSSTEIQRVLNEILANRQ